MFRKISPGSGKKASGLAKIASWSPLFEEEMLLGAPLSPLMDAHVTCFSIDAALKSSLDAPSSFYGGGGGNGEFMASAVRIFQETGIGIAVNAEISTDNEVGRNSLEEYQWNY